MKILPYSYSQIRFKNSINNCVSLKLLSILVKNVFANSLNNTSNLNLTDVETTNDKRNINLDISELSFGVRVGIVVGSYVLLGIMLSILIHAYNKRRQRVHPLTITLSDGQVYALSDRTSITTLETGR
ncbi:MAG: hypothetical protein JXA94_07055 [Parachlamydiales bacterium]|nr:hypothetical protein [Parachlamydiales bacterium]